MIDVSLLAKTDVGPIDLASYMAGICYQDTMPELGKRMDTEGKLFKKTIIRHSSTTSQHLLLKVLP